MVMIHVVEGNDLSGKSTLAKAYVERLESHGIKARFYGWDSTAVGKSFKSLFTQRGVKSIESEVLLLFSGWLELLWKIKDDHEKSPVDVVVLDRYIYSTFVYQCNALNSDDDNNNSIELFDLLAEYVVDPNRIHYLEIDRDVQLKRMEAVGRELDDIEKRIVSDPLFSEKINDNYNLAFDQYAPRDVVHRYNSDCAVDELVDQLIANSGLV